MCGVRVLETYMPQAKADGEKANAARAGFVAAKSKAQTVSIRAPSSTRRSNSLVGSLAKGFLRKALRKSCGKFADICKFSVYCARKVCGNSAEVCGNLAENL